MKKLIFVAMMAVAGMAHAGGAIIISGGIQDNRAGPTAGTETTNTAIKVIGDINRSWDADIMFNDGRNNSTDGLVVQYEAGVRYKQPVAANVVMYLRGGAGAVQVSGMSSQTYLALEPGVIWRPAGGPITTKVDYTFGTGINTSNLDIGMTRAQLGYDITKNNSVFVRKDWMRGDLNFDVWWMGLAHRF